MKKRYNLVQAKDIPGRDKPIWLRHGSAFKNEDGNMRIKLESLPIPNADGEIWLNLFEDDGKKPGDVSQPPRDALTGFDDDDIGF
ncbi:MAG: hypothetical protein EBU35_14315 [Marivivens sp.]|nr:hypothetical protein [Marivivens sp.]